MICIVGESASGKSTVEKLLCQNGYEKIVSYTTRKPRTGEVDGVDYHFITDEEFDIKKENNEFVENSVYNGWQYGFAKADCNDNCVIVLSPHGLRQLKKCKELDVYAVYINVPRRDRLIKILQRGDDIEESYRRNLSDVGMFDGIEDEVDLVVRNYNYTDTPQQVTYKILEKVWE